MRSSDERGTAGWLGWLAAGTIGALLATLVSAASFGILTIAGLLLGAAVAGRIVQARNLGQWLVAGSIVVSEFAVVFLAAGSSGV